MRQPQLLRHLRGHRSGTITLGGMVPRCNKGGARFARQVRLWLRDFTGDKGVCTRSQRAFVKALGTARTPRQAANGAL